MNTYSTTISLSGDNVAGTQNNPQALLSTVLTRTTFCRRNSTGSAVLWKLLLSFVILAFKQNDGDKYASKEW